MEYDPGKDRWDVRGVRPRRTGRFRILAILAPPNAVDKPTLKRTFGCPVVIGPVASNEAAYAVEKRWDASAPDDFDGVRKRYADDAECAVIQDPAQTFDSWLRIDLPNAPWRER